MKKLPKSVIKTIRYIKYEAPEEKLLILHRELEKALTQRQINKEEVH